MSHFVRTFKRRKIFLDQLEAGNSESFAARAAGGELRKFKRWRDDDPDFAKDWEEALEAGTDFIEDVATERALKKSDSLMAMILKARRPEKFDRGSKLELSGGISVEGSRAKLLNKVARLQAQRAVSGPSPESESEVPEAESAEEESTGPRLLPAPASTPVGGRGSKRQAVSGRGRAAAKG